jgi:non-canonical (house-cleaning) NTP pyrophosphatase
VGLEGGLEHLQGHWFDRGWIVVMDREGNEGIGSTVGMPVDPEMVRLVTEEGLELGTAADRILGTVGLKHGQGHFGYMTKDLITRATGYRDAVIVALSHLHMFETSRLPSTDQAPTGAG